MDIRATPISIGVLYDFPQGDDGASFERALQLGLAHTDDRRPRPIELNAVHGRGLPIGSEHEMRTAFAELESQGVLAIIGPSISDNALIVAPLCDAARVPAINYSGGERTRSEWMLHYQVGSLEEEPPFLAARIAERGFERSAVLFDESPVGRRYAECFDAARAHLGLRTTASAGISPLADDGGARDATAARVGPGRARLLRARTRFTRGRRRSRSDGLGSARRRELVADVRLRAARLARRLRRMGVRRHGRRHEPDRAALAQQDAAIAAGPVGCAAYDMGRLLGEALVRADHLTREGVRNALRAVKWLPATSGEPGTLMGFGNYDHGALKGHFLVLREWKQGKTIQVAR